MGTTVVHRNSGNEFREHSGILANNPIRKQPDQEALNEYPKCNHPIIRAYFFLNTPTHRITCRTPSLPRRRGKGPLENARASDRAILNKAIRMAIRYCNDWQMFRGLFS